MLVLLIGIQSRPGDADDSYLDVWILGTGHSDALVFSGPCGELGLLDTGAGDSAYVLEFLDNWYSRADLEWIAVSNYLPEHADGVRDVGTATGIDPRRIYDRGGGRAAFDSPGYRDYYDWVTTTGRRQRVNIGDQWALCGSQITFRVVSVGTDGTAVGGLPVTTEADRGLCLHVEYRDFDMATCSDISGTGAGARSDVESPASEAIGRVEVVKVNAHGAPSSSNNRYVSALNPQAALIPVGSNDQGLPDASVVDRWRDGGAFVAATHTASGARTHGDIWVWTDGSAFVDVSTERTYRRFEVDDPPPPPPSEPSISSCEKNPDVDTAAYSTVFRDGAWHVRDNPGGGYPDVSFAFGREGDVPVMGDWNDDGVSTPGVFRRGRWYLRDLNCGGAADHAFTYGEPGDVPIVGDWDGDGDDTIGIIRNGRWHLRNDNRGGTAQITFTYGRVLQGDLPLAGDWDGDGDDSPAIVRNGRWHIRYPLKGGTADEVFTYGRVLDGDIPLAGDWDGDGDDTPAIVRVADWYVRNRLSGGAHDVRYRYGTPSDVFVVKPRGI